MGVLRSGVGAQDKRGFQKPWFVGSLCFRILGPILRARMGVRPLMRAQPTHESSKYQSNDYSGLLRRDAVLCPPKAQNDPKNPCNVVFEPKNLKL